MSNKTFAQHQVITNGAMASTNTLTSAYTDTLGLDNCSYQMIFTGTPTGTWAIEVSNNYDRQRDTGDWTVLTLATPPTAPAGATGNTGADLNALPFRWVRLKYTNASGTGTLQVHFFGKAS